MAASTYQDIGYKMGGTYTIGIFRPATLSNAAQSTKAAADWPKEWMKYYTLFTGSLTLKTAMIPGCNLLSVTYTNAVEDFALQTQSATTTMALALAAGARAFNIHSVETSSAYEVGALKYKDQTPLTVANLISAITTTYLGVAAQQDEIFVLDFQTFRKSDDTVFTATEYNAELALITGHSDNAKFMLAADLDKTFTDIIAGATRVAIYWSDATSLTAASTTKVHSGLTQSKASSPHTTTLVKNQLGTDFTAVQTTVKPAVVSVDRPDTGPAWVYYTFESYLQDTSRASYYNVIYTDFYLAGYMTHVAVAMNLNKVQAVTPYVAPSSAAKLVGSVATTLLALLLFF